MKTTLKEIRTSCSVLGLYSLILTMFVITSIAFLLQLICGLQSEISLVAGFFQLVFLPLSALILFSSFAAYYQFFMSAPFKIGNIAKQLFLVFEISTTINFAFSIILSILTSNKMMAIFQMMDYFYILILGYLTINLMSTAELKMNLKGKGLWVWLIDYFGVILLYAFQLIYIKEMANSKTFYNISLGLIAVFFITVLILRIVLRKSTSDSIRSMKKIKRKKIKAS